MRPDASLLFSLARLLFPPKSMDERKCMMKNLVVAFAVVFALMCSQACAQRKSESSSAGNAKASPKGSPVSTSRTTDSKKAKVVKDEPQAEKTKSTKKQSTEKLVSEKSTAEKKASKSESQDALTDEQQKKIKSMLRQTLKPFAAAELTDEQREKADEFFGKAVKDYVTKRSRAMITDELQKKQTAAMKELKSSSKNAREQAKEAFITAGFSEDQIKVFKATYASLNKAKRDFGKTLSDEQIDCLPEPLQSLIRGEEK